MIGGIIITHGPMSQAFIQAAEAIMGKYDDVYGFSTTDMIMEEIMERIEAILRAADWPKETLILVSLKGGSCWQAGAKIKNKFKQNVAVLSGVNLAMLVTFLSKRESLNLEQITQAVYDAGIKGIDRY